MTAGDADRHGEIDFAADLRRERHDAATVFNKLQKSAEGGGAHETQLFHGATGEVPGFRMEGELLGAAREQEALQAKGGHRAGDGGEVGCVGDAIGDDDAFAGLAPFGEVGDASQAEVGAHGERADVVAGLRPS